MDFEQNEMKDAAPHLNSKKFMVKLIDVNPQLVCFLCAGYFVNAATIVECLHTFCKTCIVRHMQTSKQCPTCNLVVHETEPLSQLRFDRTMQDIVAKLVPGIVENERQREIKFIQKIQFQQTNKVDGLPLKRSPLKTSDRRMWNEEKINILFKLERNRSSGVDNDLNELRERYARCSVKTKVLHAKLLLSRRYNMPLKDYNIRMQCNGRDVTDSVHMKLIYVVHWKRQPQPIVLRYWFEEREVIASKRVLDQLIDVVHNACL